MCSNTQRVARQCVCSQRASLLCLTLSFSTASLQQVACLLSSQSIIVFVVTPQPQLLLLLESVSRISNTVKLMTDLRQEVAGDLQSWRSSLQDVPDSVVEVVRYAVQRTFQLTMKVDWSFISPAHR